MNPVVRTMTAFALGAAAMYWLDPVAGRRRRAMAKDRAVSARHKATDYVAAKSKRVANRTKGVLAKARSSLSTQPVEDDVLHEQIRARLGRLVEHPGQLEVSVQEGRVMLTGHLPGDELKEALQTVSAMRGVESVDHRASHSEGDGLRQ